jgi:hypothetical protein
MENKLFKFDWKVSMPIICVGFLMTMVATSIIIGYNTIYDISHILLFLMTTVLWIYYK